MKKKIAFIGIKGLPSQAGVDRVVESMLIRLDRVAFEPTVYCCRQETPPDFQMDGVRIVRLPAMRGKHLNAASLYILATFHALLFGKYDLVHVHNVEACFISPLLRLKYKVVSTSHASVRGIGKWGKAVQLFLRLTEYLFINFSNISTSVSLSDSLYYKEKYGKEVHYVPNGVEKSIHGDTAAASSVLREANVEQGKFILYSAGRIVPSKGCHVLLEAYRDLETDIPLLIIGETSHVPAYTERLKELADERVRFSPFLSSREVLFGVVRSSLFFVYPTTFEGMSMMILEVASLGTPLICSDIPANTSFLPEWTMFFQSENADHLREKLRWALDNPDRMERFSANLKGWVYREFDWDKLVHAYERLYNKIGES